MLVAISSEALILECTYSVLSFWRVPSIYTCTGRIVFSGDPRFNTEVSQNHLEGRSDSDVAGVRIRDQAVGFVPLGINNFFPNLESFDMMRSDVAEVSSEALRGLSRLRQFSLFVNRVQIIDEALFRDNPHVIGISFGNNIVRHVAHKVFDHLSHLDSLGIGVM